jgi:hypothetical protein
MALTKPTPIRNDIPVLEVASKEQSEMVRVNFEVEKTTRSAWKAEAARRDVPLADLLRNAMIEYLSK